MSHPNNTTTVQSVVEAQIKSITLLKSCCKGGVCKGIVNRGDGKLFVGTYIHPHIDITDKAKWKMQIETTEEIINEYNKIEI